MNSVVYLCVGCNPKDVQKIRNILFLLTVVILFDLPILGQIKRSDRFHGSVKFSHLNWDSTITITKAQLDSITSKCVSLLTDKDILQLSDNDNADIIRLSNSGFSAPWRDTFYFQTPLYSTFLDLLDKKQYFKTIKMIYPDWLWSRGMGIFIPKLLVEFYGTPHLRSYFLIEN